MHEQKKRRKRYKKGERNAIMAHEILILLGRCIRAKLDA